MSPAPFVILACLPLAACRFDLTAPTPANQTQTTQVTVTPPPTPPTPPTPPSPPTPLPPGGNPVPIPTTAQAVAANYAATAGAALVASCQTTQGEAAWQYLDGLLVTLRANDARWGYVCRAGNCADLSGDVIAYLGSGAPPIAGARGTWGVDVISGHCGPTPMTTWNVLGYDAQGVWGTRGRF